MSLDIIKASQRRPITLLALGAVFLGLGALLLVMGWPPLGEIRTAIGISRQPQGPRLVFAEPVADYGAIPIDKMVTHYFEFTNQGDIPLTIEGEPKVKTIAGCWPPQPVVGSTTLKPGESSHIKVHLHMHPGMGGPHHFVFTVHSNDPVEPEQQVAIKVDFQE